MTRLRLIYFLLAITSSLFPQNTFSQFKLEFGNISTDDLGNKIYKPDPGADAVILSDIGVATLNYRGGFFVRLERDVRIRIINSNGFDYADVEVPFSSDDNLIAYKASSFNLRNGERIETPIPKKNFIREESSKYRKFLKFNFPDVHEGTVLEYSYILEMKNESVGSLVPWQFQRSIPVISTALTVTYPDFFIYKTNISGSASLVQVLTSTENFSFAGESAKARKFTYYAQNLPAFSEEPYMKNIRDNQTMLTFELASVNFPGSSQEEITPTYETLTDKLLTRADFGYAINKAATLKKTALGITSGMKDDLSRVKAIHEYISQKILWDGSEDYTSSLLLRTVFNKEKGNSADINMILIAMLRSINIKADPVILSTRSNGSINQLSAMIRQFNYLVARVSVNGEYYMVDATDPLRPFDMLPFECLNGPGRLINKYEAGFVDLKNSEEMSRSLSLNLRLSENGQVTGDLKKRNKGYRALEIRKLVKIEGEEGYGDLFKMLYSDAEIIDLRLLNLGLRDSDLVETSTIRIEDGLSVAGERMLLNPYFCFAHSNNPFSSPDRKYPVDFGCPVKDAFTVTLQIPPSYEVAEMPDNVRFTLGKGDAEYVFDCELKDDKMIVKSSLKVSRTSFNPSEYASLREFYAKMLQSQTRLAVLRKKI
ncbi:MAG TPA: transglutaminase domain-containing protein [Bacteroidales bacterium]|nr:transglutaminase domain-containing protein [Bacteroidales bacterium]